MQIASRIGTQYANQIHEQQQGTIEVAEATEIARYAHLDRARALEDESRASGQAAEQAKGYARVVEEAEASLATYTGAGYGAGGAVQEFARWQEEATLKAQLAKKAIEEEAAALDASQAAADRAAVAQVGLSEALLGVNNMGIASVAVKELDRQYNEGNLTIDEYTEAVTQTQLAFGLADEASVNLGKRMVALTEAVGDGRVAAEDYDEELQRLIDIHDAEHKQLETFGRILGSTSRDLYGAERATGALGRGIDALPEEKHVTIYVDYVTTGNPPPGLPSNVPTEPPTNIPEGRREGFGMGITAGMAGGYAGRTVAAGMAAMGAGWGGGNTVINVNIATGAVRTDADIEQIIKGVERVRLLRGVRMWETT